MPLFLRPKFGFRTVAVSAFTKRFSNAQTYVLLVFWTLILLSPQPSDGVIPGGWYGTFYEHYGENLEHLNVGDVFEKQGIGALLLIYDRKYYFQMHTGPITEEQREVTCHLYVYPKPGEAMSLLKKVKPVPDIEGTLALVERFIERFLPFHWNYCNKFNYMNYILYGQLTVNEHEFKECPLAFLWNAVSVYHIANGDFRLMDSNNEFHKFTEYNYPKERARGEPPSKRARGESSSQIRRSSSSEKATTSGSSKQLGRTLSGQQLQASSFRRMISGNPFKFMTKKRGRSV